jgi:RNA polymerase sigma factor (TIGR02999 family)
MADLRQGSSERVYGHSKVPTATLMWGIKPMIDGCRGKELASEISLTEQLQRFSSGEAEFAEAVLRAVLPKLHEIAERELHREHSSVPLFPTELIHEVWLRSIGKGGWQIKSRQHFYAVAALAMRRVLIDFARNRQAQRRGSGVILEVLDDLAPSAQAQGDDVEGLVRIGLLMEQLEKDDRAAARVVDMHYFAGFTLDEIAEITGLSLRQVRHRWEKGRDWLKLRL